MHRNHAGAPAGTPPAWGATTFEEKSISRKSIYPRRLRRVTRTRAPANCERACGVAAAPRRKNFFPSDSGNIDSPAPVVTVKLFSVEGTRVRAG
jgi:hypothetical protein